MSKSYPDCCDFHRETKDMFILMKCANRASDDAVELQGKVRTLVDALDRNRKPLESNCADSQNKQDTRWRR
jgi:hypothetical protein